MRCSSLLLFSGLLTSAVSAALITCDAPSVRQGEAANITCHFDEDVVASKKNIKVQRRPKDSVTFDPDTVDTVLDCYWTSASATKCSVGEGYEIAGRDGRTAVLHIPEASDDHVGNYMCEIVPSDPSDIRACDFDLKEGEGSKLTILVAGKNEDVLASLRSGVTAAVLLCCLTLLTLLLLVALVLFYRRKSLNKFLQGCTGRCRNRKKDRDQESGPDKEAETPLAGELESEEERLLKQRTEHIVQTVLRNMREAGEMSEYLGFSGRPKETETGAAEGLEAAPVVEMRTANVHATRTDTSAPTPPSSDSTTTVRPKHTSPGQFDESEINRIGNELEQIRHTLQEKNTQLGDPYLTKNQKKKIQNEIKELEKYEKETKACLDELQAKRTNMMRYSRDLERIGETLEEKKRQLEDPHLTERAKKEIREEIQQSKKTQKESMEKLDRTKEKYNAAKEKHEKEEQKRAIEREKERQLYETNS